MEFSSQVDQALLMLEKEVIVSEKNKMDQILSELENHRLQIQGLCNPSKLHSYHL